MKIRKTRKFERADLPQVWELCREVRQLGQGGAF